MSSSGDQVEDGDWVVGPVGSEDESEPDLTPRRSKGEHNSSNNALSKTNSERSLTHQRKGSFGMHGIVSSPSFNELEKAIGATLNLASSDSIDGSDRLNSPTGSFPASKLSSTNLTQQKINQQRIRQQQHQRYAGTPRSGYTPVNNMAINPYAPYSGGGAPPLPSPSAPARQELSQFINETESRALVLFHSPLVSSMDIRNACSKHGVLYYIRPEFHGKGVTFISYFDLRAATAAKETLAADLGPDADATAHYSVMLHAAQGNAEEYRLVVQNLPAESGSQADVEAIFTRYGPLRSITRVDEKLSGSMSSATENDITDNEDSTKENAEKSLFAYAVEYFNTQDSRLAASELSTTSGQLWNSPNVIIKFAVLDDRKQQLCRHLLATLSRWRTEMAQQSAAATAGLNPTAWASHAGIMGGVPGSPTHLRHYNMNVGGYGGMSPINFPAMAQGQLVLNTAQQPAMAAAYAQQTAVNFQYMNMLARSNSGSSGNLVALGAQQSPLASPRMGLAINLSNGNLYTYGLAMAAPVVQPAPIHQDASQGVMGPGNRQEFIPSPPLQQATMVLSGTSTPSSTENKASPAPMQMHQHQQYQQYQAQNQFGGYPQNQQMPNDYYNRVPPPNQQVQMRNYGTPSPGQHIAHHGGAPRGYQQHHMYSQPQHGGMYNPNGHAMQQQQGSGGMSRIPPHHNGAHSANINNYTNGGMNSRGTNSASSSRPHSQQVSPGGGVSSPAFPGHAISGHTTIDSEFVLDVNRIDTDKEIRTTIMVRNIPNKYSQQMLLEEVNVNHEGKYDFFYLPIDFKNRCNVGYCFVNFMDSKYIPDFVREFNGQRWKSFNSEKVCAVSFARIQGKSAMIARFQNSSLLEKDDEYRPLLFYSSGPEKGRSEPFPMGPVPVQTGPPGGGGGNGGQRMPHGNNGNAGGPRGHFSGGSSPFYHQNYNNSSSGSNSHSHPSSPAPFVNPPFPTAMLPGHASGTHGQHSNSPSPALTTSSSRSKNGSPAPASPVSVL